ncbi:signal recognition particle protein [uncultured Porphyromonas sp.]|uniref:signal recognition particle protein n=1 Tax=uncultured Porphyromonas sp. TaxID=159274 RepID=UPI0025D3DCE6|nr:signal recognition particle protein [uncultured Porphyromonas sp.]
MFESLSDRLLESFKNLKGEGSITELNVADTVKDIRKALLEADVNYTVASDFTKSVLDKAVGEKVVSSIKPGQKLVQIVHDELTRCMGGSEVELRTDADPNIILMSGLQGSGKTTFAGKLANMLHKKKGLKPLLVAGDVYRPAAIEQLKVIAAQIGIPVYSEEGNQDPVAIAERALAFAKMNGRDTIIIDTAGRLAVDDVLMTEIANIKAAVRPTQILFVVDSMTGQDAVNTAKEFNDRLDFDGVVLTKLDGDTRGGAALSIRTVVDKPILFIGTGEKMEAIDVFYPTRMADRILGMGDVVSLVERMEQQYDEKKAAQLESKIRKNKFDFDDFLDQIQQIKKMGNLKDLLAMIPGVGSAIKDLDVDDSAFSGIEAIIRSMTPEERANPDIINAERRKRIAAGSGKDIQEVNRLIKQFNSAKKMMKKMSSLGLNGKGAPSMAQMRQQMRGGR